MRLGVLVLLVVVLGDDLGARCKPVWLLWTTTVWLSVWSLLSALLLMIVCHSVPDCCCVVVRYQTTFHSHSNIQWGRPQGSYIYPFLILTDEQVRR